MAEKSKLEKAKCDIIENLEILTGDKLDICYEIYKIITSIEGNEAKLLRFFYENSEMIEQSNKRKVTQIFFDDEHNELEACYGKMIDGILEAALQKRLPEEEFYQMLWDAISSNLMLEDDKAKVFAIYYLWIDVRIPYFGLETGLRMENEEFKMLTKKGLNDIKKSRFILTTPMEQRTERASLLLRVLDSIEDERERAVLMVHMMDMSGRVYCREDRDEEIE